MLKFKTIARTVPLLLVLVLGGVNLAKAQGVSAFIGFGAATDSSNNTQLEPVGSQNPITGAFITNPDIGPTMNGAFGVFGADFMWKQHLGFGGEYSWRLAQENYAPQVDLTVRPAFYDFNVIFHPLAGGHKVVPEIQGGIGGANLKFYETASGCLVNSNIGCSTISEYASSSNHFQVHFSGGVRFYIKGGIYVRPQFDGRWVSNFVEFGSDFVPEYTVAVGYTFGSH